MKALSGFGSFLLLICLVSPPLQATVDDPPGTRLRMEALFAPVQMTRDAAGFPHILAQNDHDAWFALGYIHARDRFFQMDYARRSYSGTLAELMGESALEQDILARTAGLRRGAEASWSVYSPEARALLEAYARGVNAWLTGPEFSLPLEYSVLEISKPLGWSPIDSLTIAKGVAFGLSFDLGDVERTADIAAYRQAGNQHGFDGDLLFFQDVFRVAPFDPTITVPIPPPPLSQFERTAGPQAEVERPEPELVDPTLLSQALERFRKSPLFRQGLRGSESRQGSNFWLVSGAHTASGFPLIANDPHRSLEAPVVFYEVHVTVRADSGAGAMNAWGVTFAGVPGIAQGCNDRVCWGSTVNPLDVTDVFQERLAVNFLTQRVTGTYFDGKVEPVIAIPQTFKVNQTGNDVLNDVIGVDVDETAGGITYLVPRRNYGPIFTVDPSNLSNIRGLSLQYTGWGATRELESILRFGRARNLDEFKEALQLFDFGSQNWAYADVDGNIAYFTSGEVPLREDLEAGAVQGAQPWFVRDGTHSVPNEWIAAAERGPGHGVPFSILPFAEMPQLTNPEQGFIVSANNDPIGTTLDNDVLNQFRPGGGILYLNVGYTGMRAGRITELLTRKLAEKPGGLAVHDLMEIQADHQLIDAPVLVPSILAAWSRAEQAEAPAELQALAADAKLGEALGYLESWDFGSPTGIREGYDPGDDPANLPEPSSEEIRNSVAATLFSLWRTRIIANTIDATLERVGLSDHRPDSERSLSALRNLLDNFESRQGIGASGLNFFEADSLAGADARDYLVLKSLEEALAMAGSPEFEAAFGHSSDLQDYRWGRLHRVVFSHPLGSGFSVPGAGGYADLDEGLPGLARSGGFEVVDASGHSARAAGAQSFRFGSGPARRFVAEMNPEGIRAFQATAGGPGGNPADPTYVSDLPLWLTNQYRQIQLSPEIQTIDPVATQILEPLQYRLRFPYLRISVVDFAGYAAAEIGGNPVELQFTGYDLEGTPLAVDPTRSRIDLAEGRQAARLGSEFFGEDPVPGGWVEMEMEFQPDAAVKWPAVAGFFQAGNFGLTRLDGGAGVVGTAQRLIFTRIYQNTDLMGTPVATRVFIINPNPHIIPLEIRLHRPGQATVTEARNLQPMSTTHFTAADLVGAVPVAEGYVEVVAAEGRGILGLQVLTLGAGQSIMSLNGLQAPGSGTLYSAQLAEVPQAIRTSIRLFNSGEFPRQVRFRAIPESGDAADGAISPIFDLAPSAGRDFEFGELFPDLAPPFVGSLVVEPDGLGVVGDIVFVNPGQGRFASILALQGQPFRKAVFGHVAALGDFFTGLAFFNVGTAAAQVQVEVFDAGGSLTGQTLVPLAPGERLSRNLFELVENPVEQAGGYVVIRSDQPLVGQEIFGTFDLRLQSAVPPVLVE